MRYPVGTGTLADFNKNWYIATDFGVKESYGYHEALDINLKTGGNSDLGQPVYAVADGKIVYYHNASHPNTGFGRHMVLECQTSRGKRWYHYAHCQEITAQVKEVKEGQVIGKIGKSGTSLAHLHFAVFKVDPSTLYKGIDSIAQGTTSLNSWWERFELLPSTPPPMPTNPDALQACLQDREKFWKERDLALADVEKYKTEAKSRKDEFEAFKGTVATKLDLPSTADGSDIIAAIERLIAVEDQLTQARKDIGDQEARHVTEVSAISEQLTILKQANEKQKEEYDRKSLALNKRITELEEQIAELKAGKQTRSWLEELIERILGRNS